MTSNPRPDPSHRFALPSGARALAVSIAAALLVGLLILVQGAPGGAEASASAAAESTPPSDAGAAALDAGVDWRRVEPAPEPDGASVAAYER